MKNRVLLFACIEKNIGDDLFVKTLCDRYPNTEFEITSAADYGMLADIPNLRFSRLLRKWMFVSTAKPKAWYKVLIQKCLEPILAFLIGKRKVAVYIVGNSFKNYHYSGPNQSKWMKQRIRLAESFYLISTNFGPYSDEQWARDFIPIFSKMTDVCFRDKNSYAMFQQIPSVRYAPDAVLTMGKKNREVAIGDEKKVIVISVIDCSASNRSERLKIQVDAYEEKMAEIANIYTKSGAQVILLNSNAKQDAPAAKRILEKCTVKDAVRIMDYDGDIAPVLDLYKKASGIVATRLHTIILAWLYDLPVFPVIYDIKVDNVMSSYGFEGSSCWIDQIETIRSEDIVRILDEYDFQLSRDIISGAQNQFYYLDKVLR